MAVFKFTNIKISGVACAVPKNVVPTESFKSVFGEDEVAKFMAITGILETRRTTEHQTASDLGFTAAKTLLERKGVERNDIGALIFGTTSPDYRRPGSSFILHKRLELPTDTAVLDINLGCSSLVYGLQVVASMMNNSNIDKALLIVGDTAGKTTNPKDRASIMLAGDTGVAVLLEKSDHAEPIVSILRSDGNGYRYLIVPGGGYRNLHASQTPVICSDGNERSLHNSFMQGTSVFTFTISDVPRVIRDYFLETNTTVDDYDCFAFHQANHMILKQIAKKIKIPEEKMPISLHRFGNTSGASPFLTLCNTYGLIEDKKLKVLLCAFGVGLSWGTCALHINTSDIFEIIEDDTIFEEGVIKSVNELL